MTDATMRFDCEVRRWIVQCNEATIPPREFRSERRAKKCMLKMSKKVAKRRCKGKAEPCWSELYSLSFIIDDPQYKYREGRLFLEQCRDELDSRGYDERVKVGLYFVNSNPIFRFYFTEGTPIFMESFVRSYVTDYLRDVDYHEEDCYEQCDMQ